MQERPGGLGIGDSAMSPVEQEAFGWDQNEQDAQGLQSPSESFLRSGKGQGCIPSETDVIGILGRNLQSSIQREKAVSSPSPEVCNLSSDTVERSQTLGFRLFPPPAGISHHSPGCLGPVSWG